MEIESSVFERCKCIFEKLLPFGFTREGEEFVLRTALSLSGFEAEVRIDSEGRVHGRVFDSSFGEEYLLLRAERSFGFAEKVRESYISLLKQISEQCFKKEFYVSPQANRISDLIFERFGSSPEFPWKDDTYSGVYRIAPGGKWYALFMRIDRKKLTGIKSDVKSGKSLQNEKQCPVDIVNLKKEFTPGLKGIFPAYHMSKKLWISVLLDDTLKDSEILSLVEESYAAVSKKGGKKK